MTISNSRPEKTIEINKNNLNNKILDKLTPDRKFSIGLKKITKISTTEKYVLIRFVRESLEIGQILHLHVKLLDHLIPNHAYSQIEILPLYEQRRYTTKNFNISNLSMQF